MTVQHGRRDLPPGHREGNPIESGEAQDRGKPGMPGKQEPRPDRRRSGRGREEEAANDENGAEDPPGRFP